MLKNISNLGKTLNKAEQQSINGEGRKPYMCAGFPNVVICSHPSQCQQAPDGTWNCNG